MPLPIAHGLLGASIIALVKPVISLKDWKPLLFGFILANCPDLDFIPAFLFGWQDFHRGITHSLFFALFVGSGFFISSRRKDWRVPLAYSLAFLLHTALDFLSTTTGAVRLLEPFDDTPFTLGLISFSELPNGFMIADMLYFSLIEALIFVPIFLIALLIARKL